MSDNNDDNVLKEGDKVSWNWGSGHPSGKVAAIEPEGATIQTAGKEVHKNGSEDNPAIVIERSGNNVVKRASELNEVEV